MTDKTDPRYRAVCTRCSGDGEIRSVAGLLSLCGRCNGRGWVFALPSWSQRLRGRLTGWPKIEGEH